MNGIRGFLPCYMAFGLFASIGLGMGWASQRDCDGFMVGDSAEINPYLTAQLDTASEGSILAFNVFFWMPGWKGLPGACDPDSGDCTVAPDTISIKYWEIWHARLFADHVLFHSQTGGYRLKESDFSVSGGYGIIFATKPTILALSKECYVRELGSGEPPILVPLRTPLRTLTRTPSSPEFNILGRKMSSQSTPRVRLESPEPNTTPTFTAPR